MKIDFRYILLVVLSGLGSYWMGGYTMNAIFYITLLLFVAALLQIIFFSIVYFCTNFKVECWHFYFFSIY